MNQILYKCNFDNFNNPRNNKEKTKFIIILVCSIILIFIAMFLYFFIKYNMNKKEKLSKNLVSNFSIMNLYSNTTDNYVSYELISESKEEPFVIGLIQIDKIKLTYPILSVTSEELLTISPCRFSGPMPNQIGNLCIAGHNYADNRHFGKIHSLDVGDIIKIFDLNGDFLEYKIYNKNEISANDLSCMNQETNGLKEITLITCNNIKGNRVCIKAKEFSSFP